jgi:hypothetical protein
MSEDIRSMASVTFIEVWDKRDGHNISRRIEYPSGKIEWMEPHDPDYRPFYFLDAMKKHPWEE